MFQETLNSLPWVDTHAAALCLRHRDLVLKWNEKYNLVSRGTFEQESLSHYVDCLNLAEFAMRFSHSGVIHDLGSGAGFPGILLAINYPEQPVVLYERRESRKSFLQYCKTELALKNVEVKGGFSALTEKGVITARAVAPPSELVDMMTSRLVSGSVLILSLGGESSEVSTFPQSEFLEEKRYPLPQQKGSRKAIALRIVPRGTRK